MIITLQVNLKLLSSNKHYAKYHFLVFMYMILQYYSKKSKLTLSDIQILCDFSFPFTFEFVPYCPDNNHQVSEYSIEFIAIQESMPRRGRGF